MEVVTPLRVSPRRGKAREIPREEKNAITAILRTKGSINPF